MFLFYEFFLFCVSPVTKGKVLFYDEQKGFVYKYFNEYEHRWYTRELKQAIGRICRGGYEPVDSPEIYIFTSYPYPEADKYIELGDIIPYSQLASDKERARDEKTRKEREKKLAKLDKIYNKRINQDKKITVRIMMKEAKVGNKLAQEFLKSKRGQS